MHLHLEVSYGYTILYDNDEARAIKKACLKFFPKLKWMSSLRNLIFLKKALHPDNFVPKLVEQVFPVSQLEHLWVPSEAGDILRPNLFPDNLPIKSLSMGCDESIPRRLRLIDDDRFRQLEHIVGIRFSELDSFPNLRYVRGFMDSLNVSNYITDVNVYRVEGSLAK